MKTILSCQFKLECNRFLGDTTTMEDFKNREFVFGEENVREYFKGAKMELPGFFDVIDPLPEYEIRPIFALNAQPGPPVARDVYDLAEKSMLEAIAALKEEAKAECRDPASVPKALLLALHGAMVVHGHEDAEGDFIESMRKAVGPDCPIFVTFDLHVNMTRKKAAQADALFPIEFYPHTDFYENALKAARCLIDTLEGQVRPTMAIHQLPMLFPTLPTGHESFLPFREKISALNREPGILTARFSHGFFAADVAEGTGTALVITDNDLPRAQALADSLAEEIYEKRRSFFRDCLTPDEALKEAKRLLDSGVHPPIVLADVNDNPGSGSTQDNPELLAAMIRADLPAMFSVLFDPESVERAYAAGLGNEVVLDLGGKMRPDITGGPVTATAKVLRFSDGNYRNQGPFLPGVLHRLGKSALVAVGNVKIVLSSIRVQTTDRAALRLFGLEPETCPVIGIKSAVHYRANYEPVAGRILEVATTSLGPIDPRALRYERAPKDLYPLQGLDK